MNAAGPSSPDGALRVVHLAAHDGRGGAARAMRRLHAGLAAAGLDSRVVVRERFSHDPAVAAVATGGVAHRGAPLVDRTWGPRHQGFSDDRTTVGRALLDQLPPADVYNLHWVGRLVDWGAVLPALTRRAPVVWTLSDLNPITGGCHYDLGCGAFRSRCGPCPQAAPEDPPQFASESFERKRQTLARISPGRLHLVAGSRWLADQIRASALAAHLPVTLVPRAVDTDRFRPRDRAAARRSLGIGEDERVALFVATWLAAPRKGLEHAVEAVRAVAAELPGVRLVCAGFGPGGDAGGLRVLEIGHVAADDRMAELLSAADVLLVPSLQEAFGLVTLEALACGTPVIAFDTGGAPDLVKPGEHGHVVPVGDVGALGRALSGVLRDDAGRRRMGAAGRKLAVGSYGLGAQAARYERLYRSLLEEAAAARPS